MSSISRVTTRKGTIRWQARWREPGMNGTPRTMKRNFNDRKAAKAYAARMAEERELRGVGDPHRHSVERYLRRWLATLRERNDHSPTTLAGYEYNIKRAIRHIGHIALAKLGAHDLDMLYGVLRQRGRRHGADDKAGRPLSAQTVLHVHRALHAALEQARKWKLIAINPAADATAPTVPFRQRRGYTASEIEQLLAAARAAEDQELATIQAVLLVTGFRRSELLGIALDALDLETGAINVRRTVVEVKSQPVVREIPKTEKSWRTVSIPAEIIALLRAQKAKVLELALQWGAEYSRQPMFLFPGLAGKPMRPAALSTRLRQLRQSLGIAGVQPVHGWRHSTSSLLIAGGFDVKTTQARLGHSTPAITLKLYTDVVDERDRAAAAQLASYVIPTQKPLA